jgi:hypothetical protein
MDAALEERTETETKLRSTASLEPSDRLGNKHSAKRTANKLRKKKAHHRKLRRSNTNG